MLHSSLSLIWASVSQAGILKPLWVDPHALLPPTALRHLPLATSGEHAGLEGHEAGRVMSQGQSAEVYVRFTVRM